MTSSGCDMPFMRLHEILTVILDLCKLYLFANLQSLRTFVCYSRDLILLNILWCWKFSSSSIPVDPFWGLDFLAYKLGQCYYLVNIKISYHGAHFGTSLGQYGGGRSGAG